MSSFSIIMIVLGLGGLGFFLGRSRALSMSDTNHQKLHSLPGYYGQIVALYTIVPALLILMTWLFVQPILIETRVSGMIPDSVIPDGGAKSLVLADVRRISGGLDALIAASGLSEDELAQLNADQTDIRKQLAEVGVAIGTDVQGHVFEAAKTFRATENVGRFWMSGVTLAMAVLLFVVTLLRITPDLRARNTSETFVLSLLIGASLVAILTTVGIVGSLLFETLNFFKMYPAKDFFFSTVWNPQFRGWSDLGILPLLWGMLYVSLLALLVAVPTGLMIAIYLAEYAGKGMRSFAKPAIEVLAGIPTIVYGLFAFITVGPFLRDYIASPLGLGSSSS